MNIDATFYICFFFLLSCAVFSFSVWGLIHGNEDYIAAAIIAIVVSTAVITLTLVGFVLDVVSATVTVSVCQKRTQITTVT